MDKEGKSGFMGISGNGLLAMLLVAAGTVAWHQAPLEGSRPAASDRLVEQRFAVQDVPARLWQDPFGALKRQRDEDAAKAKTDKPGEQELNHSEAALAQEIGRSAEDGVTDVVVMAVLLPGGPYAENEERRRRTRYAVLAGLDASDFEPLNATHLGYFFPSNNTAYPRPLPEAIPYEWFQSTPRPATDQAGTHASKRQVLVLWLDNDALNDQPFNKIKTLFNALDNPNPVSPYLSWDPRPALHWQVLGPVASDGLRAMLTEASKLDGTASKPFFAPKDVRFYSDAATVSDAVLLAPLPGFAKNMTTAQYLGNKGISFLRTLGDDTQLATSLVEELQLRGLKTSVDETAMPKVKDEAGQRANFAAYCQEKGQRTDTPHQIAVVGDWDTLYGRNLLRQFSIDPQRKAGFCVNSYSYQRGLDGQLPEIGAKNDSTKSPAPKSDGGRSGDAGQVERAEGQGQLDYLRRLAAVLQERDAELKSTDHSRAGLRAIGVLGNDVHDKLMLLRALRPAFPNAIFFTTDLDVRLLHPKEQSWARNLLVASSFGLRLDKGPQAGAPPFRDNYQTAAFFTTQLALEDAAMAADVTAGKSEALSQTRVSQWFAKPRIFEVGRDGAFDFSPDDVTWSEYGSSTCLDKHVMACKDIHPPGTPRYPHVGKLAMAMLISGIVLLLWLPGLVMGTYLRQSLCRYVTARRNGTSQFLRWLSLLVVLLVVQIGLPWLLAEQWQTFAAWLTNEGKPISFDQGISIWPTEAIYLMTLVLCGYMLWHACCALSRNLDEITVNLQLGQPRRVLVDEQKAQDKQLFWWQRLASVFSVQSLCAGQASHANATASASATNMSATTVAFWKLYIVRNRTSSRLLRSAVWTVLMGGFAILLLYALGDPPGAPQRGPISEHVQLWLAVLAVGALTFLVLFVCDATFVCVRFVRALRLNDSNWPPSTRTGMTQRLGELPTRLLDHWIDLQFVAQRTRCVCARIYSPFIVLSLLLLSRSAFFDAWHLPNGVLAMALLCITVALACALALRRTAEASRSLALKDVNEALLRANARVTTMATVPTSPTDPAPAHLEQLKRRIEELHEGAFAPFSQQPLLKAALLPFASFGGTTLMDYLTLANI